MKKLLSYILLGSLLSLNNLGFVFAGNTSKGIVCDTIIQPKVNEYDKLSYICKNGPINNIVFDGKIVAKYSYGTIWDYAISKNKSVAVIFADDTDVFNSKVFLNNKQIGNYKYYSGLKFNEINGELYFISGDNESNKLIGNGKDITPKGVKNIYEFSFLKNGDNFMYGCGVGFCNIYKNQKILSTSSTNLTVKGEKYGYIKDLNGKKALYINNKEMYKTLYDIGNLSIDKNGNYIFIEKREDKSYVIKNGKTISKAYFDINQFIVSDDMKNFYFFTQSENDKNIVNLVYNDNVIYSTSGGINTDITFYKNTLYFQKSDSCYYDSFNETDKDFCGKGDYQIKVSKDGNNIVLASNDKNLLKINGKNYNSNGSGKMDFLGFSSDSKKAWFRVQGLENEKIMKIAIN